MKSNTEGWSNQQLNDRIEELEDKLEAVKTTCLEWKDHRGSTDAADFLADDVLKILGAEEL